MLLLQFQAGNDCYGLEVSRVIEVIPMVTFRPLPHAEATVAGLFNYRGMMVPVIDVTVILASTPSRPLMSTRIILVDYPGRDGVHHVLGLLAERVTETVSCTEADLKPTGIDVPDAPYLGEILIGPGRMLQRLKIEALLPPSLQEALFQPIEDSA